MYTGPRAANAIVDDPGGYTMMVPENDFPLLFPASGPLVLPLFVDCPYDPFEIIR